ncbi:MAG: SDR family NAD(P)-dependent oxidoreductase [Gammaproteobacteria bacterium]|nr:SDR family NAD(P)-dependent oxidoreductase [Gammaproteobacteria bacterium]
MREKTGKGLGINIDNLKALHTTYPDLVVPINLDVTDINNVLECQKLCGDTDILFNNAGVECATRFTDEKSLQAAQFEMAVNYFGVHNLCHAFWDALKSQQSACIVNILSVASFTLILKLGTYCASKSAAHFLTQALRKESEGTNLKIYGVYPGYVDTQMTKNIDVEKATPLQIAMETCDGIESGVLDIFPDKMAKEQAATMSYQNHIFSAFDK